MSETAAKLTNIPGNNGTKKRNKFVELAEKRTVNAIRSIRVIGKLGNPSAFEYTDSDVKKIVTTLSKEIDELKTKFSRKNSKDAIEFKL